VNTRPYFLLLDYLGNAQHLLLQTNFSLKLLKTFFEVEVISSSGAGFFKVEWSSAFLKVEVKWSF